MKSAVFSAIARWKDSDKDKPTTRKEVFRNAVSKGRFWVLLSLMTKVPRARGHETNPSLPVGKTGIDSALRRG